MVGEKVVVRVPATTANLGPGFDCLGMALALYNTITIHVTTGGLNVRIEGEGAEDLRWGEENRVLRAVRAAFQEAGQRLPGLSIELHNQIPLGRGLGSSAAATVGGLVAGNALCSDCISTERLLKVATQLEGHPDNVAPALLGGLVIAVQEDDRLLYERMDAPPGLSAALFVPDFPMPTAEARRVLPTQISRADAVYNMGRAALLVAAFARGRYDLLDVATHDRMHQPYREAIFPAMPAIFTAAREAGALGVFLSGAGSTIIALCLKGTQAIADAMAEAGRKLDVPGRGIVAPLVSKGAQAEATQPPRRRRQRSSADHW
jgi:homoserine kinase